VYRPEASSSAAEVLRDAPESSVIARGLGRSYGDPAINGAGAVMSMVRLNHFVGFDREQGWLECEAGVTLAEILEHFLPRGWFLPVVPGTKFVTVGGAIAQDIHGKNHHRDGSFGNFVEHLDLLTAPGEVLRCSPDQHAEVFWATVGGAGLTGVILRARLRLMRVETGYVRVDYQRAPNLDEALALISATDTRHAYSVAWIDCLAQGRQMGRAVIMSGGHASRTDLPRDATGAFAPALATRPPVPFDLPGFVLSPFSVRAFNAFFYRRHPSRVGRVLDFDRYFFPLDSIPQWNRIYGRRGFVQYQATFPHSELEGLRKLLERLSGASRASFLAVLKRFGAGGRGYLSYPIEGFTLSLDIPMRAGLLEFLHEIDRLVLDHDGRLYLAKDASMAPETFAAMYPRLPEFLAVKQRVDPRGRLASRQARRLRLV
jgi:decaprenylphospho-beta-D-ribofuranose 2-oxidase